MNEQEKGFYKKYNVTKVSKPQEQIDALVLEFGDPMAHEPIHKWASKMLEAGFPQVHHDVMRKLAEWGYNTRNTPDHTPINRFAEDVNDLAREKGWWDSPREPGTILMLMVSELAEAMEEDRNEMPPVYFKNRPRSSGERSTGITTLANSVVDGKTHPDLIDWYEANKPEGVAVELADCVIRIMDYFAHKGWNLENILKLKHNYNKTRSHRHGGKRY